MLRFPLQLSKELAKARFARISHPEVNLVQLVDAADLLHRDSSHPISHEKIRQLISSRSPVVWIGGSEPLDHPGVAHLVRVITQNGHFVFLETNGTLLRRRIHEFQPVPRLFLTVRLEPGVHTHASVAERNSSHQLTIEGIRAARLSGFFVCVKVYVYAGASLSSLSELVQFSRSLEVDGIVVSSANGEANLATEARKLVGSLWWQFFSRLIQPSWSAAPSVQTIEVPAADLSDTAPQTHADEESVRVA